MKFSWLETAKRLEAIAQTGLTFAGNEFDRERYEEIRNISHSIFHNYTDTPLEKIKELFTKEDGYPTPKVDVRGVIFRDNRILMVKEILDNHWSLPGGWADIGLTPNEVVVKEVKEEAGLNVIPVRLLALLDKKKHDHPPSPLHVYKVFILCSEESGKTKSGIETLDVDFFDPDDLPPLSLERNTPDQIKMVYEMYSDPGKPPVID